MSMKGKAFHEWHMRQPKNVFKELPMKNEAGLRLTGIRVLVRPPKIEEMTSGGIVLPQATKDKEERAATTGVLIDAAEDAWKCKELTGVKAGETVFFARYAGDAVSFLREGITYRVMNATDIVGVVEAEFDSQFRAAQTTVETFGLVDAV
jgi:co-chaperonin GroES (HSP10)